MNSVHDNNVRPSSVPHPGENVIEYLDFFEWSQSDLARRTGLTPKTISEICNGKTPITTATALALEKAFQRSAGFWLSLQRHFDEAEARSKELLRLNSWQSWTDSFPLKEMKRLRFSLPKGVTDTDSLLNFFGVSSPDSWAAVWRAAPVNYRQTRTTQPHEAAVFAWVREAEVTARDLFLAPFNEDKLLSAIPDLRRLSRMGADQIMEPVQQICAACGVAVVWVPELKNTRISGCARWLSESKAMIGLTLRYKTDDQLWFTLFHEIGHIVLHRSKRSFVVDNPAEDLSDHVVDPEMQRFEAEADRFSSDSLLPPQDFDFFVRRKTFTNASIHEFAEKVQVGPGIVVGRLQHDKLLKPHQGNALKQKLDFTFPEEN